MKNRLRGSTAVLAISALSLIATARAADGQGDPGAARSKISMCIGCHAIPGYKASFPEVYSVPAIGGQSAGYIASALRSYAKGERRNPTMRGIAGSLSDQDILDIAAYYAAQK